MTASDPADWLSRYTAAGGWYLLHDSGLHLGWPVADVWRVIATCEFYREIEGYSDRCGAVAEIQRSEV